MDENRMLISIIVPVYQVLAYLPACLDSVLAQTYPAWELLAVDDGSTDGSGAVCDAYAKLDSRIHVIHQSNQGVSAARNRGVGADEKPGRGVGKRRLHRLCGRG